MSQVPQVIAWLVSAVLVEAAIIDGLKLKVPNWLTFPFIVSGWAFWLANSFRTGEWGQHGIGYSVLGAFAAGAPLVVFWKLGGMGAGDVKLYAGFGAWVTPVWWFGFEHLVNAFAVSVVLGAVMAIVMVLVSRTLFVSVENSREILGDLTSGMSVEQIAARAKARKPRLMLLPYGVPLTIGSLAYLAFVFTKLS